VSGVELPLPDKLVVPHHCQPQGTECVLCHGEYAPFRVQHCVPLYVSSNLLALLSIDSYKVLVLRGLGCRELDNTTLPQRISTSVFQTRKMATATIQSEDMKGLNGTTGIEATSGEHKERNAWAGPGPAAFDFRSEYPTRSMPTPAFHSYHNLPSSSLREKLLTYPAGDVVTTPTPSMLRAIQQCTLLDDVFMEDPTTLSLESHLASLTRHEASLFVLSGTMGNELALRSHLTQPPYSILCDYRAHILEWEAGGVASLCGALVKGVVPSNGVYLTLEDIKKNIILSDDVHACPTRAISLENTLGGTIMPLSETQRISQFARSHGVRLHLDGARLWEAVVAGAGSLTDYTTCFDSVSLCFSKGLGAPVGSILVGSKPFIKQARWIRKSIGGGLRQPGIITAAARVAVDETFGRGPNGEGGLLRRSHEVAREIAKLWEDMGGKLAKRTETNMVWFDLEDAGMSEEDFVKVGEKHRLRVLGGRLVVHYQISAEAMERLRGVMAEVLERKRQVSDENGMNHMREERKGGEKVYGT
jgi:threonine aldolase